ncbi:hypothetical protein ACE6H2_009622 [Prunus campanulata]
MNKRVQTLELEFCLSYVHIFYDPAYQFPHKLLGLKNEYTSELKKMHYDSPTLHSVPALRVGKEGDGHGPRICRAPNYIYYKCTKLKNMILEENNFNSFAFRGPKSDYKCF